MKPHNYFGIMSISFRAHSLPRPVYYYKIGFYVRVRVMVSVRLECEYCILKHATGDQPAG